MGSPVTATYPNGNRISYSSSVDDNFQVDPQSGQITVAQGADLDHESRDSHDLTVTATDSHGDSASKTVTINIANIEEPGSLTLQHGPLRAGSVINATLSDPDGGITGETWQWSRSGSPITTATPSSHTATDADVGHVLTATVHYTDGHGPGKSAQASPPTVRSETTPPPSSESTRPNPSRAIDENARPGTPVGTPIEANDANSNPVTYQLSPESSFSVGPARTDHQQSRPGPRSRSQPHHPADGPPTTTTRAPPSP